MQSRTVQIEVLQDDGALEKVERTVWLSHYGPVVTLPDSVMVPVFFRLS